MSGVLLPEDEQFVPSFFSDHQHIYDPGLFRNII
jgi:hypothetical protein